MIALLLSRGLFGGVDAQMSCVMAEPSVGEIQAQVDDRESLQTSRSSISLANFEQAFEPDDDPMERFKWTSEADRIGTVVELNYFQKGRSPLVIYGDDHRGRHHYQRPFSAGSCTVSPNGAGA